MTERDHVRAIVQLKNQQPVDLDPRAAALIVVDVQRYFVEPGGTFGRVLERVAPGSTRGYFDRVESVVLPNLVRLLAAARARDMAIVFTGAGTAWGDGRDLPGWLREFDGLGLHTIGERVWPHAADAAWRIDGRLGPRAGEPVLNKASSGPLASVRLDQLLRNRGVRTVLVSGLTTDVCVAQAARELADRDFSTVIVEDACTTLSDELHQATLEIFALSFGRVRATAEVLRLLDADAVEGGQADRPSAAARAAR